MREQATTTTRNADELHGNAKEFVGNRLTSSLLLPDFRVLFQAVPGLYLVLTADFKIVAASDAYRRR
jgi:hypothetical protein